MTPFAIALDVVAVAILVHTIVNAMLLRRPPELAGSIDDAVSLLVPMRDEAGHAQQSVRALLTQRGLTDVEILVYDDGSTDGTGDIVRGMGVRVLTGAPPEPGTLGKPLACTRLASAARGSVLVFVDADVELAPDAVTRAIRLMRTTELQFVSPYPRQRTGSMLEWLVQPLLQWSWLAFLPLRLAERSARPSLAAANGQFLVVDKAAYDACGGHANDVLDDIALARALRASGARGGFVDGTALASCRMYDGPRALVDGYAKSLWRAFGSTAGAVAITALLVVVFVVPWCLVAVTAWAWPAAVAGQLSQVVAALRTGGRIAPQPLSILAFSALVVVSLHRRAQGRITWKGRPVG